MKISRRNVIGGAIVAAYVAALVITAIVAGRPGTPNVPFSLLLLLGIAAYAGWSLWKFFTGRSERRIHDEAHFVAFMALIASLIVAVLTKRPDEGMPAWLVIPFGVALATTAWGFWADWRRKRR